MMRRKINTILEWIEVIAWFGIILCLAWLIGEWLWS